MLAELRKKKIKEANAGDVESAKWLMNEFVATVKANRDAEGRPHHKPSGIHTQFDECVLDWFADCFQKVLDGVEVEKALGVKLQRGRASQEKHKNDVDCRICIAVIKFKDQGGSETLKDAKARAAREFKIGVEKVNHAWKNSVARMAAKVVTELSK